MINRVPGTVDHIHIEKYTHVMTLIRRILNLASFEEIKTPILEHKELFHRSVGAETDVVGKEMYMVTTKHTSTTDEAEICLRPEGTAPIMRAYLQQHTSPTATGSFRAYLVGPFFRHERPQKGRLREFEQVSVELIRAASHMHDIFLLQLFTHIFQDTLNITGYQLSLNYMGCQTDRIAFRALMSPFLHAHRTEVCPTCIRRMDTNPLRVFDCKSDTCQAIYTKAPIPTEQLCQTCTDEWDTIRSLLHEYGISFVHAPRLVRGLDYYTKTVFEFSSALLGAQSTFCAGGRYDHLAEQLGAKEQIPAIGGAIGVERLMMILEAQGAIPGYQKGIPTIPIIPVSPDEHSLVLHVTLHLIKHNIRSTPYCEPINIGKQLKIAHQNRARYVVIIGASERLTNSVKLKDMELGSESTISLDTLVHTLRTLPHTR